MCSNIVQMYIYIATRCQNLSRIFRVRIDLPNWAQTHGGKLDLLEQRKQYLFLWITYSDLRGDASTQAWPRLFKLIHEWNYILSAPSRHLLTAWFLRVVQWSKPFFWFVHCSLRVLLRWDTGMRNSEEPVWIPVLVWLFDLELHGLRSLGDIVDAEDVASLKPQRFKWGLRLDQKESPRLHHNVQGWNQFEIFLWFVWTLTERTCGETYGKEIRRYTVQTSVDLQSESWTRKRNIDAMIGKAEEQRRHTGHFRDVGDDALFRQRRTCLMLCPRSFARFMKAIKGSASHMSQLKSRGHMNGKPKAPCIQHALGEAVPKTFVMKSAVVHAMTAVLATLEDGCW